MTSDVRRAVVALTLSVAIGSMLAPIASGADPYAEAGASSSPTASVAPTASAATTAGAITHACDLWTADEVSAALGGAAITVQPASSGAPICLFVGTETAGDLTLGLHAGLTFGDASSGPLIDQARQIFPDAEELTISGIAAIPGPTQAGTGAAEGWSLSPLYVFPDPVVMLELLLTTPDEIDGQAALTGLVEVAASRIASVEAASPAPSPAVPAGPSSAPAPSTAALGGLAGLFPSEVGGGPVSIGVDLTGPEYFAQVVNFKPMEQKVTKALKKRKLKASDLSFVIGSAGSGGTIAAFQVKGKPIKPLVNVLLESLAMEKTGGPVPAGDVAGKDAFGVTSGFLLGGGDGYAYAKDDVLWLVFAFGPDQAEIFEKLP